jgi:hypothetical protein
MASPFKKLAVRNWRWIRDQWLGYLPAIDFATIYPAPMLWDLPDFGRNLGETRKEGVIAYIPGVREAIFREAIILARKLLYCWSVTHAVAARGRQTWTSIAAYEASFYGAKAFCYLHGFASLGRDSKFYLDAFHRTEIRIRRGERSERVIELDLEIYNLQSRMEHSTLWAITERLLNTTIFEPDLAATQSALKRIDWSKYSTFRNRVMYVGPFWLLSRTLEECDLTREYCHPEILRALDPTQDSVPPFSEEYFTVAKLIREALHLMVADLASLAPALTLEAGALRP